MLKMNRWMSNNNEIALNHVWKRMLSTKSKFMGAAVKNHKTKELGEQTFKIHLWHVPCT